MKMITYAKIKIKVLWNTIPKGGLKKKKNQAQYYLFHGF
jgi:hypothetical protein